MKKKLIERIKEHHAKKFQNIVFKAEKVKWKVIKKLFPNYLKRIENVYKTQRNKELKKAKTEEERLLINQSYKNNVLALRKEYYTEQNMNYHINMDNPYKLLGHLQNNKNIHKSWLIIDAIALPILISLLVTGNTWSIPLIAIVGLESIKNLECINLQNYCMNKYIEKQEKIERVSIRNNERKRTKYGKAQDLIKKTVEDNEEIPSISKVIKNAENKESLEQLKLLLLKEKQARTDKEDQKNNSIGGI